MPGIIPDHSAGGVVVRDAGGNCLPVENVLNAYCPPAGFLSTCEIRYLTNDCAARILPAQINAFQSELLCLAATWDPDGTWNCESPCNLSAAFNSWVAANVGGAQEGDGETISTNAPFALLPAGAVAAICADDAAADTLAACMVSGGVGNQLGTGADGRLYVAPGDGSSGDGETISVASPYAVIPLGVVNAVCDDVDAKNALGECMVSTDAGNQLVQGSDGALFAPAAPAFDPDVAVTAICGDDAAADALAACLISTDADNQAVQGTDGRLFVAPVVIPPTPEGDGTTISTNAPYELLPQGAVSAICADDAAADALAACLISDDADNLLSVGADGRLLVQPGAVLSGSAQYQYPPATIPTTVGAAVVHGSNTFNIPNPTSQPIDVMVVVGANLGMIRDQSDVNSTVQIFANLFSGPLPSGTPISSLSNIEQVSATDNLLRHTTGTYRAGAIVTIPPGGLDITSALLYTNTQGSTAFLQTTQHSIAWYGVGGTLPSAPPSGPFVLFGNEDFSYPDLMPIPGTTGLVLNGEHTFTIPNTGPVPIIVQVQQTYGAFFTTADSVDDVPRLFFSVHDGASAADPALSDVRYSFGNVGFVAGSAQDGTTHRVMDESSVFNIEVPPGGRTLTAANRYAANGSPVMADVLVISQRISWYGVSGTSAN
ncbi:hypothetical protein [Synechococcus phage Ssp-JY38]|nr:hypothetical protein [Synechococcus phage Yong-L2-223]